MLKAIIFDFDGVIVDSEPMHWRAFVRVMGNAAAKLSYEHYLDRYVGYDDRDFFRTFLRDECGQAGLATDENHIRQLIARKADVFEAVITEGLNTIPGAERFIRHAARKMPIAVASGATRRDVDLVLKGLGLLQHFAAVVTADDVERSKPDPQTYQSAVRQLTHQYNQLNLQPSDCLAIEDTFAGITSARAAGLRTLGLSNTGGLAAVREAERCITTLEGLTVEQLQQWYQ